MRPREGSILLAFTLSWKRSPNMAGTDVTPRSQKEEKTCAVNWEITSFLLIHYSDRETSETQMPTTHVEALGNRVCSDGCCLLLCFL